MDVNGLVCAFCAQGIEKTLKAFPATDGVFVSLEHRIVAVHLKDGQDIDDAALRKAITDAGYKLVAIRRTDDRSPTSRRAWRRRRRCRCRRSTTTTRGHAGHGARMTDAVDANAPLRRNLGVAVLTLRGQRRHAGVLRAAGGDGGARRRRGAGGAGDGGAATGLAVGAQGAGVRRRLGDARAVRRGAVARALAAVPRGPAAAAACRRLRTASSALWWFALVAVATGAAFAFVVPLLVA